MKLPLKKKNPKYVQGIFTAHNKQKYRGKFPIVYRSSLELKVFRWFDNNSNVLTWGSESVVVPYQSPLDGRIHRYFVDLVAALKESNGNIKKLLIEIKPHKQTLRPEATKNKKVKTMIYEQTQFLLIEEPTYEVQYLIEEKNRNTPSILHIQGPFLMANEANKNKRVYPLEEMVKEVGRYTSEMIDTKRATGELNHPSSPDINLERVCHVVTELKQNGNIFEGKSKVLSTPMGQIVRSLIMDGVKLGVSSRALGRLQEDGRGVNRVSDFRLVAVDVVADPSVPSAFVNGILESKQWILNEDGKFAPTYERFENAISNIPNKEGNKYLTEQIIKFINSLKTL